VLAAGQTATADSREALELLCRSYWYPLYAYVRRRGYPPADAQDLTQGFFCLLLEMDSLSRVQRSKGKFRSFLLASMNHFLANEWDRQQTLKRGGGLKWVSLDDETAENRYRLEPATNLTPEKIYERRWVLTLLDQALRRLREENTAAGKDLHFDSLKHLLSDEAGDGAYAELAGQLDMTPGAVAVAVHRLRQRYRELVREEIARTVASPADLEEELNHLFAALG
jgi:RNA polymerase sigma-70 factor (ECF subfamily)